MLDSGRQFHTIELCYVLAYHRNPRGLQANIAYDSVDLTEITQGLVKVGGDGLVNFVYPGVRK